MRTLSRLMSGAARRLGAWPLQAIGPKVRAEVLERATENAITLTSIPGGLIRFYTPSPLLISRAASVLSKETDTIQWIDSFEDGEVFWDVGANVGVYSLYAATRKRVSVLAFEPLAANFHVLSKNINLNHLGERIASFCVAFAGSTQLGVLNMASSSMGAAISQFGRTGEMSQYWEGQPGVATHGMIGFAIDEFIMRFAPPFPNHLKIDVDGIELQILEGACQTLRDPRLQSVLVELSVSREGEHRDALLFLKDAGFHFISRGATQGTKMESAANHLFQRLKRPVMSDAV